MKIDRAEIVRMAKEARFSGIAGTGSFPDYVERKFERFAALVAAAQREIDAKLCENLWHINGTRTALEFAASIRANKD